MEYDVRIYFRNVPTTFPRGEMKGLASLYGRVRRVDFLPSSLHNGRAAGFIHMDDLGAAMLAIDKINSLTYDGCPLFAHLQRYGAQRKKG